MADPIKDLCESRHPEYEENLKHWDFVEDTYEGGRDWFEGNIFKFIKEGDKEYAERVSRAYRFNHTKQVVDQVDKYLFKMPIARKTEDAPEALKQFWERSTRNGLDIDSYSKRISPATSKYGRVYLVVDSTVTATTGVVSQKDAKDAGAQIYSYIARPQDVLDMSYDDMDQLNWILIREFERDDTDPLYGSRGIKERFRLWTRTEFFLFEKQVKGNKTRYVQIDRGAHGLAKHNMVPVIQADHTFSEELYEASGLIDDVAYLDRAIANYLSNLDAIIQDQTFSQMAMPAQGLMPGEEGTDKLMEMGTKRVILFNGEAGTQPFYLSPDPKQAELVLKAVGKLINEIYHSVGLTGERTQEDNGGGVDNASGVAKGYDFERVNSLLAAKAKALEMTERKLAHMVCLYAGEESVDVDSLVSYPADFDVRSVYDEFEIASRLMLLSAPDEVRREQMRSVIAKLFPAASKKVNELMETSLKDWPPELIEDPGLGAPKQPGAKKNPGDAVKAASTQKTAKQLAA